MTQLLQFLTIFSYFSLIYSYNLVSLSTFIGGQPKTYPVGIHSKIYVISQELQASIGNLMLTTTISGQSINGTFFLYPTLTGTLTPFIPSQDGDTLTVQQTGTKNLTGWFYITEEVNFNVYPLTIKTPRINFQPGTNIFFGLESSDGVNIPVAEDVVISDTVSLRGYVGVPEDNGKLIFDSGAIQGVTTYNQLQLSMPIFHFKSNGVDVEYDIYYSSQMLLSINFAGLLMTKSYPTYYYGQYSSNFVSNDYSDNITFYMVCHFDNTQLYTVNVTLDYVDGPTRPIIFPLNSTTDTVIQTISPLNVMRIGSNGPYALQFQLRNTDPKPTTVVASPGTSTVMTTTQSARGVDELIWVIVLIFMRFV